MLEQLAFLLISPLGTSLLLGLVALVVSFGAARPARRRLGFVVGVVALGWLWVWSTPLVSDALRGWIENQAGPRSIDRLPHSEVMVVLGGGISGPRPPFRLDPDLNSSADRVWHAARLFRAGKATRIILAGGEVSTGNGSEAEAMRLFLLDLGLPDAAIVLESTSINTLENARNTAEMLAAEGVEEVILVTSALHMPRARKRFDAMGVKVIPAPTDFEVSGQRFHPLRLLPAVTELQGSTRAIKEVLGSWTGR